MVHLSIAIGRFVEALFWAILRAAGWVAVLVATVMLACALLFRAARGLWRRR